MNAVAFDGMGHAVETILSSDPDGVTYTNTQYDGNGLEYTVSNPYRTTSDSTYGITTYTYDALGRPYLVKEQDNSTVQTAYDQTCTSNTNTLGTLVTDEAGNQRRSCTDGLGRLVEVDEPGLEAVSATQATGSFTISGAEQSKETTFPTSGSLSGGITVSGSEKSNPATPGSATGYISEAETPECILNYGQYIPPYGTVSVQISGTGVPTVTGSFEWGGGTCQETTWTPGLSISQIAANLASSLNGTGIVTATSNGTSFTITAIATGTNSNYNLMPEETYSPSGGGYFVSLQSALSGGANLTYDTGTVKVIVDGYTASASYGSGSTATSVAASLLSSLGSLDSSGLVTTSGTNPIGLTSKATGTNSNYSGTATSSSTDGFSPASFSAAPASFTFTGGANAGYTYDTGTVSVTVGTFTATVNYGSSDTPSTVASNLANYFNTHSGSPVTAQVSGATVDLTSVATGTAANVGYSGASLSSQPSLFSSPSFSAATQGSDLTGGTNSTTIWSISAPYVTLYNYDTLNDLTCVEQHGSATSGTGCSAASSSDATSPYRIRRFSYDSLARLLTAENPETNGLAGQISYAYDFNGNLASKTGLSPNQVSTGTKTVTTSYTYDSDNRLKAKSYADTYSSNGATPPVQYGYDGATLTGCSVTPPSLTDSYPIGRRTSMCDGSTTIPGSGSTSWTHDPMGRVSADDRFIGSVSSARSVTYVYNLDGSINKLTAPDGKILTYTVGTAGRPISVADASGDNYVTSATYAPPGELQTLNYGASIHSALAYNSRLQPMQLYYGTGTPPAITSMTASCPSTVGNVMNKTYNFSLGAGDNGNVVSIANCLN